MLKEAPYKVGEVVAFRLVSGDEILGEVTDVTDSEVSIKKPCTLAIGQDGNVGLTPAALLANPEKSVVYSLSQVMARMTPREDAVKSYMQFSSGIQLATPEQTKNIAT
jgi:hypothetical protein